MKVFGLTGGIGMGKSAAAELLQATSLPVIDTDALAKALVEPGQPALQEIQQAFGTQILSHGRLSREKLAAEVFSDVEARHRLEAILHPRIRLAWKEQVERWRSDGKPLAIVVIPLLFETGAESEFAATICVACSPETQRQRLLARGWSAEEIQRRIAAQWAVERKMALSNFVVWTEGALSVLSAQLARVVRT